MLTPAPAPSPLRPPPPRHRRGHKTRHHHPLMLQSSGRTFTLMGEEHDPGLLPRYLEALMSSVSVFTVFVAFMPSDVDCI